MGRFVSLQRGGVSYLLVRHADRDRYPDCEEVPSLFAQGIIRDALGTDLGGRPELFELYGQLGAGPGMGADAFPSEAPALLDPLATDLDPMIFSELVLLREPTYGTSTTKPTPSEPPEDAVTAPAPPASEPAAPPKETEPSPNIDQDAQAATLELAAEQGVPFCEECERQRQERAA